MWTVFGELWKKVAKKVLTDLDFVVMIIQEDEKKGEAGMEG